MPDYLMATWEGKALVLRRDGQVDVLEAEVLEVAGVQVCFVAGRPADELDGCIAAGIHRAGSPWDIRGYLPFLAPQMAAWRERWAEETAGLPA